MTLPCIVATRDSGVTQEDLNAALVEKIELRTNELLQLAVIDADRITETVEAMQSNSDLSEHSTARLLRVLEKSIEGLHTTRTQLQYRIGALNAARVIATPEPLHLLKESA